jgi:hypothetical protein
LPDVVIITPTINAFKSRIDNYWKNLPSTYYEPDSQNKELLLLLLLRSPCTQEEMCM